MSAERIRGIVLCGIIAAMCIVVLAVDNPLAAVGLQVAPAEAEQQTATEYQPPIITQLRTRTHVIGVHSTARSTKQLFTVAGTDGQVVAERISLSEFRARFPELYDTYRWSFAEAWAGSDVSVPSR